MSVDWSKIRLRTPPTLAKLALNRAVPLRAFSKVLNVRDTEKPFQYVIQIETKPKRGGDSIFRQLTVSESERGALRDILNDAADALINSPVAARENLVSANIIKAQRYIED